MRCGRLVVRMAKQVLGRGEVEVQLPHEGGIEGNGLELDNDMAAQLEMIEEQVEVELLAADLETHLSADEREPTAQFEQEALNVIDERLFHLAFAPRIRGAEEVEEVRILEDLGGHVGIDGWKRGGEVGDGLALTLVGVTVDLECEDAAAPALLDRLAGVPESHLAAIQLLEQSQVVVPGDLCKSLLHNCPIWPCGSKRPHVLEVTRRQPPHVREGLAQIAGQPIDHLRTPTRVRLPLGAKEAACQRQSSAARHRSGPCRAQLHLPRFFDLAPRGDDRALARLRDVASLTRATFAERAVVGRGARGPASAERRFVVPVPLAALSPLAPDRNIVTRVFSETPSRSASSTSHAWSDLGRRVRNCPLYA
jgi:hypothetical protein